MKSAASQRPRPLDMKTSTKRDFKLFYKSPSLISLSSLAAAKWHGKLLENFEKQIKFHSGEKKRQLILIINGVCLREESCVSGERKWSDAAGGDGGALADVVAFFFFSLTFLRKTLDSSELLWERGVRARALGAREIDMDDSRHNAALSGRESVILLNYKTACAVCRQNNGNVVRKIPNIFFSPHSLSLSPL